jgi:RecA-family ATPase
MPPAARPQQSISQQSAAWRAAEEERQAAQELADWGRLDDLGILDLSLFDPEALPELLWLVPHHFSAGSVALVAGDGGTGKTTLLMQLLNAAALGLKWLGHACERARGLMLACEDGVIPLLWRQRAITRALGIPWLAPYQAGLQIWPRAGQDNTLFQFNPLSGEVEPTHLWQRLEHRCRRDQIRYLAIDTVGQTCAVNGNDEHQVVNTVAYFRRLAMALDGVVILTKHPSLSGRALGTGESGSTAWSNTVRSRFYLSRDKEKRLTWRGMKSNYDSLDEDLPLRWQDGVFVVDAPEPNYGQRYWQE